MSNDPKWLATFGAHVLYVEDEPLIAMETEDLLRDLGFEHLTVAHNFERAEKLVDRGGYSMAVMDMNLNGALSAPLVKRLIEDGVPVLVTSGYNTSESYTDDQKVVAVQKPFTEAAIISGLERLAVLSVSEG